MLVFWGGHLSLDIITAIGKAWFLWQDRVVDNITDLLVWQSPEVLCRQVYWLYADDSQALVREGSGSLMLGTWKVSLPLLAIFVQPWHTLRGWVTITALLDETTSSWVQHPRKLEHNVRHCLSSYPEVRPQCLSTLPKIWNRIVFSPLDSWMLHESIHSSSSNHVFEQHDCSTLEGNTLRYVMDMDFKDTGLPQWQQAKGAGVGVWPYT